MLLNDALRDQIRAHLAAFEVRRLPVDAHRAAAVALVLIEEGTGAMLSGIAAPPDWSSNAALLVTRRAEAMSSHAGQWALPGGRIDTGETAIAAAMRETLEEVGLELRSGEVLGTLDDYVTRSGFMITPVIVWAGRAGHLSPAPQEVASVHRIALTEFMRPDAPLLDPSEDAGREILRMPVGDTWIAAPTAAIVYQFIEVCIRGRGTRVAHYDQPLFARR